MAYRTPKITIEQLDEIIDRMIDGENIVSICRDQHMPARGSVYRYLAAEGEENEAFRRRYDRAIRLRTMALAEEILEIGDDNSRDWKVVTGQDGKERTVFDHDAVNRSKLMCANRWAYIERLDPKRYGRQMTLSQDPDNPVSFTIIHQNFVMPTEEIVPKVAPGPSALLGVRSKRDEEEIDVEDI